MKITRDTARAFFAHPSQLRASLLQSVEHLPDHLTYYAANGVCLATNWSHWPGVLMVHLAAHPSAWGRTTEPTRALLHEAWAEEGPDRITAWMKESNRAVQALCRRVGMEIDGRFPLAEPVVLYGWRP